MPRRHATRGRAATTRSHSGVESSPRRAEAIRASSTPSDVFDGLRTRDNVQPRDASSGPAPRSPPPRRRPSVKASQTGRAWSGRRVKRTGHATRKGCTRPRKADLERESGKQSRRAAAGEGGARRLREGARSQPPPRARELAGPTPPTLGPLLGAPCAPSKGVNDVSSRYGELDFRLAAHRREIQRSTRGGAAAGGLAQDAAGAWASAA